MVLCYRSFRKLILDELQGSISRTFHAAHLCKPLQDVSVSLCSNNGALLSTSKLSSLNSKHLFFTCGSVVVELLDAAGVCWT